MSQIRVVYPSGEIREFAVGFGVDAFRLLMANHEEGRIKALRFPDLSRASDVVINPSLCCSVEFHDDTVQDMPEDMADDGPADEKTEE